MSNRPFLMITIQHLCSRQQKKVKMLLILCYFLLILFIKSLNNGQRQTTILSFKYPPLTQEEPRGGCCWGLTLFLFKLVLRQEDGPHQLPHRRLNRHKEFLGVSAEKRKMSEKERPFNSTALFHFQETHPSKAPSYPNTPTALCLFFLLNEAAGC